MEESKKSSHPSYGLAHFSRQSIGGKLPRLFGSAVKCHHVISLTISRGERYHDLHEDRYMDGPELISVIMTEAQFAELITTFNRGGGTPCTIEHVCGKINEYPPEDDLSEAEQIQEDFKKEAKRLSDSLKEETETVRSVVENSRLPLKDKKAIMDAVNMFHRQADSVLPFLVSQLAESGARVVSQLKTEVVAFTRHAIEKAGISHLKSEAPRIEMEDKR